MLVEAMLSLFDPIGFIHTIVHRMYPGVWGDVSQTITTGGHLLRTTLQLQ